MEKNENNLVNLNAYSIRLVAISHKKKIFFILRLNFRSIGHMTAICYSAKI